MCMKTLRTLRLREKIFSSPVSLRGLRVSVVQNGNNLLLFLISDFWKKLGQGLGGAGRFRAAQA
jgi:hypothetical protein